MAPGIYRVEVSPNNRAGCKNKECKDAGVKITKGQLRFATFVTIQDHQSWQYKHWGCVTPKQIENVKDSVDDDANNLDGYEELPEDLQEKISKALEEGHVADEDWIGDIEMNRPGKNGFRTPQTKKARKEAAQTNEDGAASTDRSPVKKRGRPKNVPDTEETVEGSPPAKKKKTSVKKERNSGKDQATGASENEAKPVKRGRKKAAKAEPDTENAIKEEGEDEHAAPASPPRKARKSRKSAAVKEEEATATVESGSTKKTRASRKTTTHPKVKDEDTDDGTRGGDHDSAPTNEETRAPRRNAKGLKTKAGAGDVVAADAAEHLTPVAAKKAKASSKKASSKKNEGVEPPVENNGTAAQPDSTLDTSQAAEAEASDTVPEPRESRQKGAKKLAKGKKARATMDQNAES